MRALAKRLMAFEAQEDQEWDSGAAAAAFAVCQKMRPYLTNLMGNSGLRPLLSRALALAAAEAPWLRAVQVKADGSLQGPDARAEPVAPEVSAEAGMVLIAHVLGLLAAFIGGHLIVQMVREVWPNLSLNDLDFYPEK
jgi:hypothetical protein